jgi:hypothetical protein
MVGCRGSQEEAEFRALRPKSGAFAALNMQ